MLLGPRDRGSVAGAREPLRARPSVRRSQGGEAMLRFTRQRMGSIDRWAILGRWLALILLAAGAAQPARAQVLYGSLAGNVTDSTGAVVLGATVKALNVGTNV